MIKTFKKVRDWKLELKEIKQKKKSLGFTPTMGALHQGHLSLIKRSLKENDLSIVSIFVNPTQFNETSDKKNYPSQIEEDTQLLKKINVPYLFMPDVSELYPDHYSFQIQERDWSQKLCGFHRKGHFEGVLTVVLKLLNIIQPDRAYFGEKDYQQYILIKNMVKALFLETKIIPCPTVREKSGLAMSSRNLHLTKEEKNHASLFSKILKTRRSPQEIKRELEQVGFHVEYVEEIHGRRLAAVHLNNVRLIDNVLC